MLHDRKIKFGILESCWRKIISEYKLGEMLFDDD